MLSLSKLLSKAIVFVFGIFVALQLLGCGGNLTSTSTPPPPPAQPTASITANPAAIAVGQSSVLTVASNNATGCTGTGSLAGTAVPLNGTISVTPTATSTYGIKCTGAGGSATASATVTVNPIPPTVTLVTAASDKPSITTAQTATITATVQGTGAFSSAVSWTATNGNVSGTGDTVTFAPTAVGIATITACSSTIGFTTVCGSTTVTVTAVPTVSLVTLTGVPATLQVGQTAQLGCIVLMSNGTTAPGNPCTFASNNSAVASINATTGVLTTVAAGTANIVATSTLNSAKSSAPATLTVTRATPTITSVAVNNAKDSWIFCPISCNKAILGFTIYGSGLQAGDQVSFSGYWPTVTLTAANIASDGTVVIGGTTFGGMNIGANQPPNFIYFTVVPQDGTPQSNTVAYAYLDGYNSASHGPNGELLNQYMGKAYVWQNASGSLTNTLSFDVGGGGINTVYETDGTNAYFVTGLAIYGLDGTGLSGTTSDGWALSGTSAENGTAIVVQPGGNEVTLYHPDANQTSQANRVPVGVMPYTSVMTTINGNTFGFVASVDGTPTLWKIDTNGITVGSAPLTGFTSQSDINATNRFLTGGWPMAVFHSGTAAGKVAVVSTHDKSLLLYDGTSNALPLLKTIALPCEIPWAVDAVDSTGQLVVACIKVAGFTDSGTTFLSIDAATGNVTTLTSVSVHAPNGFPLGFLADANNLYVFSALGAPDMQPNK